MSPVTTLTYILPHRLLSSLARKLAYSTSPAIKQWLIDAVVRRFGVDLSEAAEPDARAYPSFNAFFTRALKPGARVADPDPDALLMPADGHISQCGEIVDGRHPRRHRTGTLRRLPPGVLCRPRSGCPPVTAPCRAELARLGGTSGGRKSSGASSALRGASRVCPLSEYVPVTMVM